MITNPSVEDVESAFTDVIAETIRAGNLNDLTVKRVRHSAEVKLGLDEDYFRKSKEWKDRSKEFIIAKAVGALFAGMIVCLANMIRPSCRTYRARKRRN